MPWLEERKGKNKHPGAGNDFRVNDVINNSFVKSKLCVNPKAVGDYPFLKRFS
jgi:hypothetical protein